MGYAEHPPPAALAQRVACVWWRTPDEGGGTGEGGGRASSGAPSSGVPSSGDPLSSAAAPSFGVPSSSGAPPSSGVPSSSGVPLSSGAAPSFGVPSPSGAAPSWGADAPFAAASAAPHAVLPDGSVDLVWHGGRLVVAGPDTGPVVAAPSATTTVGVRLRPGAAATLGEAAWTLRDERVGPAALWGRAGALLEERVAGAVDDRARLTLLLDACAARGADGPADPGVAAAVAVLAGGRCTVAEAARAAGVGERQLRRRFLDHVGYGPTTLRRVLRLQRFLQLAITTDDDLAGLAARAGYADQAHLTRETGDLAGATPAALVAARRGP